MGSDAWATGEKSRRKFNSGLGGRPRARRAGVGGIARGHPAQGAGPEGLAVTHRAAAAAVALRAAPAIQLLRRAPPQACPARLRRPAPGPEPPPARGHVKRDLSGTRHPARLGVGGSGSPGALPFLGQGGSGRPAHFRWGKARGLARRAGRKWENRGYRAQPGWAGRRRRCNGDQEPLGGWACGCALPLLAAAGSLAAARGALDCRTRSPGLAGRVHSGRMAAAVHFSVNLAWLLHEQGKGEVRAAGRGLDPGTSEEGILFLLIELFLCFGFFFFHWEPQAFVTLWSPMHGGLTLLLGPPNPREQGFCAPLT